MSVCDFHRTAIAVMAAAQFIVCAPAFAQAHENGYGPDPDGDTNPATRTRAIANIGATDVKLDPRFTVMTFEPPPGKHNSAISTQYTDKYGVTFSKGLKWQICDGQRYGRYDSLCTYIRPPSGSFAAYYRDDWKRPLTVSFKKPVCAVMTSVYATGGKEGEKFKVTLTARKANGDPAGEANVTFAWTQNTFRWRVMAGGFFLKEDAASVDISVARAENAGDVLQFLIDDLAYVESGCEAVLEEIKDVAGFEVSNTGALVTKSAQ
ncbi:MAG: hypothetical protein A3E78_16115 [Alphaproteobacteria bacterium RIFCSPHIGHO2_12_FULL_63_12]|nr:MAG: hypothetical protein A3E78_16115 [Alphaproteobacteria bacterium RIFCSPHIGHO2_12_FULL_63_12]